MVVIDGIVFSIQRHGGISVYFQHLLDHMERHGERAVCSVEEPSLQPIDTAGGSVSVVGRPARRLERYRPCRVAGDGTLFHSSYYRVPDRHDIPSVVTVYDFIYERFIDGPRLWVHREQKRRAIRAAQAIICISQSTRDDLLEFVGETPGQPVHVIHCGVSDDFHDLNLDAPSTPFILYVGGRRGYKNFRQVLDAMAYLGDVELHCVGGGRLHPDELAGVPETVARRVRHLGFVTDEELNVLYNRALCLAYPSRYEGFGIPVVEAMRAGCPVVSTDCKAVLEVGKDALTVALDLDPRTMADAILRTSSSERATLKRRGLTVAREYSWEAAHRRTLDVYRSLGGQRSLGDG